MLDKRKENEVRRIINNLRPVTQREDAIADQTRERLKKSGFNSQERLEYMLAIIDLDCLE